MENAYLTVSIDTLPFDEELTVTFHLFIQYEICSFSFYLLGDELQSEGYKLLQEEFSISFGDSWISRKDGFVEFGFMENSSGGKSCQIKLPANICENALKKLMEKC